MRSSMDGCFFAGSGMSNGLRCKRGLRSEVVVIWRVAPMQHDPPSDAGTNGNKTAPKVGDEVSAPSRNDTRPAVLGAALRRRSGWMDEAQRPLMESARPVLDAAVATTEAPMVFMCAQPRAADE